MNLIPVTSDSLILLRTHNETSDAVSFFFQTSNKKMLSFKPGQFANIGLCIDQQDYYRSYSISSLPTENEIQLTVKRVSDGIVSNWLIDHLNLGDTISLHSIAGNFNIIDAHLNKHLIFISAGCGITPVMSMVRYLLENKLEEIQQITFIHCARDENNLIYEQQINQLAKTYPQFKPIFYVDQFINPKITSSIYQQGPLNQNRLEQHLSEITKEDNNIFLCGPIGFMEMIQHHLVDLDFNMDYFKHESFTPEMHKISSESSNNQQLHNISVPDFDIEIEAKEGEILLEVLQNSGVPIIAACRSGICGSCKCQVTAGAIEVHHQAVAHGILTEDEVQRGYTLACSSTIKESVIIKL